MGIIAQAAALLPLRLGCPARLPDAAPPPFASLGGRAGADPRKGGRGREKGNPACPHSLPSNKPRAQQHHDPGLKVPAGGGASGQAVGDVNGRSVNGGVAGAAKPVLQAAPQRRRAPYDVEDEAWGLIRESVVRYCGSPVGTIAACDPNDASPLNYDQVFIRDFVPSGIAFLLKGEYDIVRNFILHTLQLQSWEKTMDCHSPGQGLMPASFKVRAIPLDGDDDAIEEILDPDFGEAAIGRVAPVDSGLWWIILLRAYGKCSGDLSVQERIDVQTGIKMILKLCLADGFDMFPTLLVTDGSCMIDRRMGIHGHPLEIQALFYSALLCAREMLTPEDGSADLIRALNSRLIALSFHIREYYWLDKRKLNEIYRYKTEEYSYDAVNKFNIYPDQIHPWLVEWIPPEGGYFIGNLQPAHMDFRFFSLGNLWSIVSSLATTHQSHAILDLIEAKWSDLVAEMPMKICYPALEDQEWKFITGSDPKNTPWSYHNGGSWPTLLWQLTVACSKMNRPEIAARAVEVAERRIATDKWPEYYDTKRARFIGKQSRLFQTWSIAGFLVAKLLLENPDKSRILWNNEDEEILNALNLMADASNPKRKRGRIALKKTYIVLWRCFFVSVAVTGAFPLASVVSRPPSGCTFCSSCCVSGGRPPPAAPNPTTGRRSIVYSPRARAARRRRKVRELRGSVRLGRPCRVGGLDAMGEPQPSKELLDLPSEPKPPSFIKSLLAVQRAAAAQGGQAQRRASHRTTPQEPREQQQHKEGKRNAGPPTEPLPKSQVLGKVKDLLGEIAKANEKLQLDAQSKPLEEYEVEALTGNEKEYIVFPIVEYTPWCSYQKTSISIIYRGPRCAVIVPLKVPAWSLLS